MVADVVGGDDRRGRVTGEQAQDEAEGGIEAAAGERRAVDVVVLDHAGDEGEGAGGREQEPVPQPARPLRAEQTGQEGEEEQGAPVVSVAERDET